MHRYAGVIQNNKEDEKLKWAVAVGEARVNATTDDGNNNKDDNGRTKLYKIGKLCSVPTKKESICRDIPRYWDNRYLGHAMRIEREFS